MKIIQYQTKEKTKCKACRYFGVPLIKIKKKVYAAYCSGCNRYIENVRKIDIKIIKRKKKK